MELSASQAGHTWARRISEQVDHGTERPRGNRAELYGLSRKEDFCGHQERRQRFRKAVAHQKDFQEKHLMRWLPRLCNDVLEIGRTDFYKGVAMVTDGFLAMDRKLNALARRNVRTSSPNSFCSTRRVHRIKPVRHQHAPSGNSRQSCKKEN